MLVLKEERLQDFGGIEEVIMHFKHAPSREVARNLLSILLDYVSAKHIKVLLCTLLVLTTGLVVKTLPKH